MELPSHPETDDGGPGQKPAGSTGWGTRVVVAVVIAFVAAIVILHLTGVVGPGGR